MTISEPSLQSTMRPAVSAATNTPGNCRPAGRSWQATKCCSSSKGDSANMTQSQMQSGCSILGYRASSIWPDTAASASTLPSHSAHLQRHPPIRSDARAPRDRRGPAYISRLCVSIFAALSRCPDLKGIPSMSRGALIAGGRSSHVISAALARSGSCCSAAGRGLAKRPGPPPPPPPSLPTRSAARASRPRHFGRFPRRHLRLERQLDSQSLLPRSSRCAPWPILKKKTMCAWLCPTSVSELTVLQRTSRTGRFESCAGRRLLCKRHPVANAPLSIQAD